MAWYSCLGNLGKKGKTKQSPFPEVPHPLGNPAQGWKIPFLISTNDQLVPFSAGLDSITLIIISVRVTPDY